MRKTKRISRDDQIADEESTRRAIQHNITPEVIDAKIKAQPSWNKRVELLALLNGCKEFTPEVQAHVRKRLCEVGGIKESELKGIMVDNFMKQLENSVSERRIETVRANLLKS